MRLGCAGAATTRASGSLQKGEHVTFDWEKREREAAERATTESGPFVVEPDMPTPTPTMPETPGSTESGAETVAPAGPLRTPTRTTSSRKASTTRKRTTSGRKTWG